MLKPQQASSGPTTKTIAGGISGAVVVIVIWVIHEWLKIDIPAEVAASMTVVVSFVTSYITSPRWEDQVKPAQFKPEPPAS
jgi:putative flippase GtrA